MEQSRAAPTGRPLAVVRAIRVQGYDVDFAGIVSNIVYIRWLEDLRVQMLDTYLPLPNLLAEGLVPVLSRTEIDYRRPIRLFDEVEGRMWLAEAASPRWVLAAELYANGKRAAQARQSGVFVHTASLRPAPLPKRLQAAWDTAQAASLPQAR
ncbi:MAG: acyl-CoA thioesterase [Anaerolineales bacterium]|nr:acyl-CoA thioesterase [Anaerolineales bacterium]